MTKDEKIKLHDFLWRFLTDFTHWISMNEIDEALNCLETVKRILKELK